MSDEQRQPTVTFLDSLNNISADEWNNVADTNYPFLRHEFLFGLEDTGCVTPQSGWQPNHVIVRDGHRLIALMPLYLKSHSYGEYVFDWSWADAWQRYGLHYYPKLVAAIPFTPATGPRLCVAADYSWDSVMTLILNAIKERALKNDISSWHMLFPEKEKAAALAAQGLHTRTASQFHWFNEDFKSFDEFLAGFSSRKRKNLKRERQRVADQGIVLTTLTGAQIEQHHWQQFHHFYQSTYAKRSGHGGYLSREFFTQTAAGMGEQVVMVIAYLHDEAIAAALFFRSSDTLYGRYWGCEQEYDCLHFEACYYQGIEYCIQHNLKRFDPGAQGEHKIQRGFRPIETYSSHWIANSELSAAIANFTEQERDHVQQYVKDASSMLPFKSTGLKTS